MVFGESRVCQKILLLLEDTAAAPLVVDCAVHAANVVNLHRNVHHRAFYQRLPHLQQRILNLVELRLARNPLPLLERPVLEDFDVKMRRVVDRSDLKLHVAVWQVDGPVDLSESVPLLAAGRVLARSELQNFRADLSNVFVVRILLLQLADGNELLKKKIF